MPNANILYVALNFFHTISFFRSRVILLLFQLTDYRCLLFQKFKPFASEQCISNPRVRH